MSPILGSRGIGVRAYGFGGAAKPNAPVSVSATDVGTSRAYNNGAATVSFSSGGDNGLPITSYTVTSSPGGFTATGASSPLTVTGLQSGVQYTYTVTATNPIGTSDASTASAGVTATTVPQTPTITSATRASSTVVSIAFTGATGGKTLTSVTATSSPSISITSSGTSSPMTATATYAQGTSYTFTITATNANGTSSASSASGSVTPYPAPTLGAWTSATNYPNTQTARRMGAGMTSTLWIGSGIDSGLSTNAGYEWNGSSWASKFFSYNTSIPGTGNYDDTSIMMVAGYNVDLTDYLNRASMLTSGGTWTDKATYPISIANPGVAPVSGGMIAMGGENNNTAVYRFNGTSWAATTSVTTSGTRYGGASFGTTAYFIGDTKTPVLSISSVGGAWSTAASKPVASAWELPASFFYKIGTSGTFIYHPNNVSTGLTLNTYLFNGSTFTVSTALPSGFSENQWAGASIGNVVSALPSALQSYNQHYRATLS
jgi:hypothetical protein